MHVARSPLVGLVRQSRLDASLRACGTRRQRGFAAVASPSTGGPLEGLRVLDMTRVLAGVSRILQGNFLNTKRLRSFSYSRTAPKFLEISGMLDENRSEARMAL